jgi:hypothetical protein
VENTKLRSFFLKSPEMPGTSTNQQEAKQDTNM